MKGISFYEQVGILIPGAVLLFGILLFLPVLKPLFATDAVTVGGLGLFLILAYALGHAVAAVGNVLEKLLWWPFGGVPTNWVTRDPPKLLRLEQVQEMRSRASKRFGSEWPPIIGLSRRAWSPLFGQLYRDVLSNNPGRLETFNGNYGLNRGLAAALVCIIPIALASTSDHKVAIIGGAAIAAIVYLYRMYRFGVNFARELFFNFLNPYAARQAPTTQDLSDAGE